MIEFLGFPMGTVFQGVTSTLLFALALIAIWYVRGMPDRGRVKNEAKVIENTEMARQYTEWRKEVHDLKNTLGKVVAETHDCKKALTAAEALNEKLVFLIELLIVEMETTDPSSKIVKRARMMFGRLHKGIKDPGKSDALNTAEIAVEDAKQVLVSTKETCAEVKATEAKV